MHQNNSMKKLTALFVSLLYSTMCLFGQSVYDQTLAPFYHGVASGDPLPDRVIIWTRVTPNNSQTTIPVLWQIATDTTFENITNYGIVTTNSNKDYTVKADPENLAANTYYFYRFYALGKYSMVGRTKTAPDPAASPNNVRFAVASCAEFSNGYFTPYRKIAQRNDIDAVIQLGDYIYEQSGGNIRTFDPDAETISLTQYRTRHSQYKLDADLQLAHQRYPFIVVWDDHEFANNAYTDNAGGHNSLFEGSWDDRKAAAMQAYFEWMPMRRPEPDTNPQRIYRKLSYGTLIDLFMLDTRIIGRNQQAFAFIGADDNDRTILGTEQRDWLLDGLSQSNAHWKIIGQQVMFAPLRIAGARINNDQWDGYTADRQRLLDHIMQHNITNTCILSGDIHSAWANDVPYSNYNPATGEGSATVEFVTSSITSDGFPFEFGEDVVLSNNSHIKYTNLLQNGYVVLDVSPERTQANYYYVNTVSEPTATQYFEAAFYVQDGQRFLGQSFTESVSPASPFVLPDSNLSPDVVKLKLKIQLQGAYNAVNGQMNTNLLQHNLLPLTQPFNTAPWNYNGNEAVPNSSYFPANTVDWILVELRDSTNTNQVLYRTACLLLSDGTITSLRAGSNTVWIPNQTPYVNGFKVALKTRHHLATLSQSTIYLPNNTVYDFSASEATTLGTNQQTQANNVWQQWAGDINHDGIINYQDYNAWKTQQMGSAFVYSAADLNLDGQVNNTDFAIWQQNAQQIGIQEVR